LAQDFVQLLWATDKRYPGWRRQPCLPSDGTDLHVERPRPLSERLSDVTKAENAEGLARQLRPRRRWRRPNGPLAQPLAMSELRVEMPKSPRQREHGANDVFSNPHFVPIGVGQAHPRPQGAAVDAIKTRARHLD